MNQFKTNNVKMKNRFIIFLALPFFFSVLLINKATSQVRTNVLPARPTGPCDIYVAAGYPCVVAHSTTRALYASYNGPLYQVMRQSDGKTLVLWQLVMVFTRCVRQDGWRRFGSRFGGDRSGIDYQGQR